MRYTDDGIGIINIKNLHFNNSRMDKKTFSLVLFLFLATSVVAELDPADKIYIESQNQKVIAQLNAKIDATSQRTQQEFNAEVERQKVLLKDEIAVEIGSSLKAVAIGLAGLIIVTMAVFKIIDLRLSATKNIKKYEQHLQEKTKEYDALLLKAREDSKKIIKYRDDLNIYNNQLQLFAKGLGIAPKPVASENVPVPQPPQKKRKRFLFFGRK